MVIVMTYSELEKRIESTGFSKANETIKEMLMLVNIQFDIRPTMNDRAPQWVVDLAYQVAGIPAVKSAS